MLEKVLINLAIQTTPGHHCKYYVQACISLAQTWSYIIAVFVRVTSREGDNWVKICSTTT
jgi:hypothetical protein